jgi:DNA (cytosine-5)-methyltransferase 1
LKNYGKIILSGRMPGGARLSKGRHELISLFCGAGGLDLGFEQAGYAVAVAVDLRAPGIASYNHNRNASAGYVADVTSLTAGRLDDLVGRELRPAGIIGGPPCQSFSRAAHSKDDDHRHELPLEFARLLRAYNRRSSVAFFAFENVPGLLKAKHRGRYEAIVSAFGKAGYSVRSAVLNASGFGVPQDRPRLILVGYSKALYPGLAWTPPQPTHKTPPTVRSAIGGLKPPKLWERDLEAAAIPVHPNHWCMAPKSKKFSTPGALRPGTALGRSFRMLEWKEPSPTIAYGNREVHVHPNGRRRLSVYEALLLQGFPAEYELIGSLSAQITQVSEAVPPPLARAIALSIRRDIGGYGSARLAAA